MGTGLEGLSTCSQYRHTFDVSEYAWNYCQQLVEIRYGSIMIYEQYAMQYQVTPVQIFPFSALEWVNITRVDLKLEKVKKNPGKTITIIQGNK